MTPDTKPAGGDGPNPVTQKPRFAFAVATVFGVGYLKPGPGTYGSIVGMLLSIFATWIGAYRQLSFHGATDGPASFWGATWVTWYTDYLGLLIVGGIGLYAADRVAKWANSKDPQYVIVDEVSGQLLTYYILWFSPLNWKIWLFGLALFRLFDIWKPFPIRHLEKLPGGWGIMADDWLAGIYAAILLRLALHFNLL
jgi:phosphatidylglycerophosphatase A